MPDRYYLPGIILLKNLFPADSFIPLTPDVEKQALYQGAKLTTKVVGQKKQVAQALYELAYDDFVTIIKRLRYCKTPGERAKILAEISTYISAATLPDLTGPNAIPEYAASAYAATEVLASYAEKNSLYEAAQAAEQELASLPPCLRELIKGISQLEDEKTLSLVLRLRGPKSLGISQKMPNKPPSEKAVDRWNNLFSGNNGTNFRNITDIPRGGSQQPVGLQFQLDEITDLNKFEKFVSLIVKNSKKMIFFGIISGIVYIIFKKRSSLKRFVKPLKKLFKKIHFIYKRVTKNRFINNGLTRRIWIFSRAVNRI